MSAYASTFTGYAPGAFHLSYPDRFLDVGYNAFDPDDIRLIIESSAVKIRRHLNQLEARELATRLLIALGEEQHIIDHLLTQQEKAGAPKENHW